jgi:carbamoyltransferase
MKILGINGLGVLPSACILQDGKMLVFAEEERFTRYKGSFGMMPENAVRFCLTFARLSLNDIDYIAFGWDCEKYRFKIPVFLFWKYMSRSPKFQGKSNLISFIGEMLKYHPENVKKLIAEMLVGIEGDLPEIKFVNHHLCHAASAFYFSGMEESYVLVLDGSGEEACTSIFKGDKSGLKLLKTITIPDSLGWFYQTFTEYLGFAPNNHEGKLMGLAAYGKPHEEINRKLEKVIQCMPNNYKLDAAYSFLGKHKKGRVFSEKLVELFGRPRLSHEPISQYHKDLAFAVQNKLEKIVLQIVESVSQRSDFNGNLCIAGGVGLNCKMNGSIVTLPFVKNLYVPSITSDSGSSAGAALVLANQCGDDVVQRIDHAYWGSSYNDKEIEEVLRVCGLKYTKEEKIEAKVAELLVQNKVVGWFQGRMESGSRALGARSILANPMLKQMQDIVNVKIKNRETWRPFAASILFEERETFVENPQESPFMAIAFHVKPSALNKIPAAVHIDGTTRPQFVKKNTNEKYWMLIKRFGDITGVYAVLNTSFNTNEEPIVESPVQAIKAFSASGMDGLAIGNFLILKN